jgi:hypothetical protein
VTRYRQFLSHHHQHLGDVLHKLERPAEAAAAYAAIAKLWPKDSARLYETARDLAKCIPLVGKGKKDLSTDEQAERQRLADQALQVLAQAVASGFRDADRLREDPAFEPLRGSEGFKKLLGELGKK